MGTRGTPVSAWGPWDAISAAGGRSRPEPPERAPPRALASKAPPSHAGSARPTCFPAARTWPAAAAHWPCHAGLASRAQRSVPRRRVAQPGRQRCQNWWPGSLHTKSAAVHQGGAQLGQSCLLGVSTPTWGGAVQLLLRGGLPSPTRPWVSPGCQLHTGCCLFGVVGSALKELTSRGTNKFLACGGGQQNGGILRVKWRFPGQLGSRRPGQSAGWRPDGQRPGGGPVDPLTQEGIGLT